MLNPTVAPNSLASHLSIVMHKAHIKYISFSRSAAVGNLA